MPSAQDAPLQPVCLSLPVSDGWAVDGNKWLPLRCQRPYECFSWFEKEPGWAQNGFWQTTGGWVKAKSRTEPWWTLVTRMAFAIQQTFIGLCCGLLFSHVSPHPVLSYPVNRHFSSFSIWKADTEMLGDPLLGPHLGPAEGRIWTVSKLVFFSMSQLPLLHPRQWMRMFAKPGRLRVNRADGKDQDTGPGLSSAGLPGRSQCRSSPAWNRTCGQVSLSGCK